ncbi:hypothetical protein PPYR_14964 [Photinus pyralis]|uniref:Gamma-interferon-inducible lysosomal thiol reductase n=1 Tax=Photinus pyralis TaxID=7054 RepID=A0A1Y1KWX9_PHOPY|nr:GILT-like protein 1 [Photinus pyralis]KAB0790877.1 hypothetical protein PPYR_14964 [Photinus pyralis]
MIPIYFLTILSGVLCVTGEKVPVTVYYESLCPDSRKFFTTQLHPLLQTNLSKWIDLTLVPYGKSNQTQVSPEQWEFTCHHGPYECHGNKIHGCALNVIEKSAKTPDGYGFNPITLDFLNCLMNATTKGMNPDDGSDKYVFPIDDCARDNSVPNYMWIENCVNHIDGSKYLAALGDQTVKFQSPLLSVPTIVFNNRYSKQESNDAFKSFGQILCKHIATPPEECHNRALILNASFLLVALTFGKFLL